ncbi:MAG TPA: putative quinol monooxygenase [Telluria sp.]
MLEPVNVVATFLAKPGKTDVLAALLGSIVAPTRAEEGVHFYDLHQDIAEPRRFVFFESWASQAALDTHGETPHIRALREQLPDLIEHGEVNRLRKLPG